MPPIIPQRGVRLYPALPIPNGDALLFSSPGASIASPPRKTPMSKIHVFDTFAKTAAGRIMHFDVVLPDNDPAQALRAARDWLASIGESGATVNAENCAYCHSEPDAPPEMLGEIEARGYAIFKLEGCPRTG